MPLPITKFVGLSFTYEELSAYMGKQVIKDDSDKIFNYLDIAIEKGDFEEFGWDNDLHEIEEILCYNAEVIVRTL